MVLLQSTPTHPSTGGVYISGCNPLVVQISFIYKVWLHYSISKCAFTMVFDVWLDEHSRCYVWLVWDWVRTPSNRLGDVGNMPFTTIWKSVLVRFLLSSWFSHLFIYKASPLPAYPCSSKKRTVVKSRWRVLLNSAIEGFLASLRGPHFQEQIYLFQFRFCLVFRQSPILRLNTAWGHFWNG